VINIYYPLLLHRRTHQIIFIQRKISMW
jgi:hypothetical protein